MKLNTGSNGQFLQKKEMINIVPMHIQIFYIYIYIYYICFVYVFYNTIAKRDVGSTILTTQSKSASAISQHAMDQQGSPYNSGLEYLPYSYDCKEINICLLLADKQPTAVLFYVFKITFSVSLLSCNMRTKKNMLELLQKFEFGVGIV